jgi:hypothetical protein
MTYAFWTIDIEQRDDGWFYFIASKGEFFKAENGPFIGPDSAEEAAKILVDVLNENIKF